MQRRDADEIVVLFLDRFCLTAAILSGVIPIGLRWNSTRNCPHSYFRFQGGTLFVISQSAAPMECWLISWASWVNLDWIRWTCLGFRALVFHPLSTWVFPANRSWSRDLGICLFFNLICRITVNMDYWNRSVCSAFLHLIYDSKVLRTN